MLRALALIVVLSSGCGRDLTYGPRSGGGAADSGLTLDGGSDAGSDAGRAITALVAGGLQSCALLQNGAVRCWGDNLFGQYRANCLQCEQPNDGLFSGEVVSLCAGDRHLCGVLRGGSVECFGKGSGGQTGRTDAGLNQLGGITDAVEIVCGQEFTCVRRRTGVVSCFGRNEWGQLGTGNTVPAVLPAPQTVSLSSSIAVGAGEFHACSVRGTGLIECWGKNGNGELGVLNARFCPGNPGSICSPVPLPVSFSRQLRQIAGGLAFTCGVDVEGNVWCWGAGMNGNLGNGLPTTRPEPRQVLNLTGATQVTLGDSHACALKRDAGVSCWGLGHRGQLGFTAPNNCGQPCAFNATPVPNLPPVTAVAAGSNHTCMAFSSGQVRCFGDNTFLQAPTSISP